MKKILALILSFTLAATMMYSCAPSVEVGETTSTSTATDDGGSDDASTDNGGDSEPTDGVRTASYTEYDDFSGENGDLSFTQSPSLDGADIPTIEERLPTNPIVYTPITDDAVYGGEISFPSINIDQDWTLRHMNNGWLFLLNPESGVDSSNTPLETEMLPGIIESWDFDDIGSYFEFTIRDGIKWSDGTPVSSEDVRFMIEDVLLNEEIYPVTPSWLNWQGGATTVTYPDDLTFRVEFENPYGGFMLKEMVVWNSYYGRIMLPSHYMSQYHEDYGDEAEILADMEQYGFFSMDEWGKYYLETKMKLYGVDYIGMPNGEQYPTLDPWIVSEDLGNGNYTYERNPYFYMVDNQGRQLPYIDGINRSYVTDAEVLNVDIISGKFDIASSGLTIEDYPLYTDNEATGGYQTLTLPTYIDHDLVYSFNLEVADEAKREIFQDLRFRQAVSLSLDRNTMNEAMYLGLGTPSQVAPRPTSTYYDESMATSYSDYNPEEAMRLLDEMGMVDTDGDGFREDLDGNPFVINMDWFIVSGSSQSGVEYLKRYLEEIGIELNLRQIDASYFWDQLHPNNEHEAIVWWLGGAGADTLEGWFSGFMIGTPAYFNWASYRAAGTPEEDWTTTSVEPPEWAIEALDAFYGLRTVTDVNEMADYARELWTIQTEQLYTLGVASGIKTPFVVTDRVKNVAEFEEVGVPAITVLENSHGWYVSE